MASTIIRTVSERFPSASEDSFKTTVCSFSRVSRHFWTKWVTRSFFSANFALISEKWLWPLEYPFKAGFSVARPTDALFGHAQLEIQAENDVHWRTRGQFWTLNQVQLFRDQNERQPIRSFVSRPNSPEWKPAFRAKPLSINRAKHVKCKA